MDLTSIFKGRVFNCKPNSVNTYVPTTTYGDYDDFTPPFKVTDDDYDEDSCTFNVNQGSLFNQDSIDEYVLSIEDEIDILRTYDKGQTYIDKCLNRYKIITINDNYVRCTLNAHLGSFRNNELNLRRDEFLEKMEFKKAILNKY